MDYPGYSAPNRPPAPDISLEQGPLPDEKEIFGSGGLNIWFLLLLVPAAGGVGYAMFEIENIWLKVFFIFIALIFAIGILMSVGNVFSKRPRMILSKKGIQVKGDPFYGWENVKDASVQKAIDRGRDITKYFLVMQVMIGNGAIVQKEINIDDMDIEPEVLARLVPLYYRAYIQAKKKQ